MFKALACSEVSIVCDWQSRQYSRCGEGGNEHVGHSAFVILEGEGSKGVQYTLVPVVSYAAHYENGSETTQGSETSRGHATCLIR